MFIDFFDIVLCCILVIAEHGVYYSLVYEC